MFNPASREKRKQAMTGRKLSESHKENIGLSLIGNTHTLGKELSKIHKKKISESKKGKSAVWLKGKPAHNQGIPHTNETIEKMRVPKPKFTCSHCGIVVGGQSNYNRWHGNNCKKII
jgi:hypothetical protein